MDEVIVGIDFGSSGSGFAYAFKDNEKEIINGYIPRANAIDKVPSEIILDKNKETLRFGAECKDFIRKNNLKECLYFKEIKMNLYEKKTEIQANNSEKKLPLKLVIQRVLEQLKDLEIKDIKTKHPNINNNNIKWVVTIPAIWEEFEKNIMMEACIKAGLIKEEDDKSLFFALEPEAASYYCIENKSLDKNLMREGDCYIICDLGGGTGDIVTHLIGFNKSLKELCSPNGGKFGANEISRLFFEEIVYKIFKCKDFNTYYKKYMEAKEDCEDEGELFNDWLELERQIKDFIEFTDLKKEKEYYPIIFDIFKDIFKDNTDINDLVNNYNNNIDDNDLILKIDEKSKRKWKINFPHKIIFNFIKKQANLICEIIKNILKSSDEEIKSIIFVGGYSSNEILISEIKEQISSIFDIQFLRPPNQYLAVMRGAVSFGLDSNKIVQRKAKYTIGMNSYNVWKESLHSKKKGQKYYDEFGITYCKDCFKIFFKINQDLKLGQEIIKHCSMIYPRYSKITFYKTLKENPIFIDEDGIEKIGEMTFDAEQDYPPDQRHCIIIIRIGGTFYDIKVKHLNSAKILSTKFEFN